MLEFKWGNSQNIAINKKLANFSIIIKDLRMNKVKYRCIHS